jgi:hypothetical protein
MLLIFGISGGFAWSPWALRTPDIDDTAVVVLAFLKHDPKSLLSPKVMNALKVLKCRSDTIILTKLLSYCMVAMPIIPQEHV